MLRRLAAILVADVVGYSRLTERDETHALTRMRSLRGEVLEPLVARHQGRIVKFMGDGMLVEFSSVVDAVRCAISIQHQAGERQAGTPPDRRLVLRIGINLGDVVVDENDLLGDGVNIAARLEQLCEPGGILVSGTVYDQLHGKIEVGLQFVGEQKVKNIERKVRTYRVRLKQDAQAKKLPLGYVAAGAGALAFVALASGGLWWLLRSDQPTGQSEATEIAASTVEPVLTEAESASEAAAPVLTGPANDVPAGDAAAPAPVLTAPAKPPAPAQPAPALQAAETPPAEPEQQVAHAGSGAGLELSPSPDAAPMLDRVGELWRYVARFDGGDCFFAVPLAVANDAVSIEAYSAAMPPVQVLDEAFRRDQGFEAKIGLRQVTPAQCSAVDFARSAATAPELAPDVHLDSFALRDGETLSGTVRETKGRAVAVLLVSDNGNVHDLSDTLRGGGGRSDFDVSVTSPGGESAKPLLLVVIATERPLGALSSNPQNAKADELFLRIVEETKRNGGAVGVALKYLKLNS